MMSSAIPARLEFQCGHAALVTLPRVKGETSAQRTERIAREKSAALGRQCDFCGPTVQVAEPQLNGLNGGDHAVMDVAEAIAAEPVVTAEPVLVADEPEVLPMAPPVTTEPTALTDEAVSVVETVARRRNARPPSDGHREVHEVEVLVTAPVEAPKRQRRAATPRPSTNATRRFLVHYQVERILQATTIREAMRQATALGATDILAITRES